MLPMPSAQLLHKYLTTKMHSATHRWADQDGTLHLSALLAP